LVVADAAVFTDAAHVVAADTMVQSSVCTTVPEAVVFPPESAQLVGAVMEQPSQCAASDVSEVTSSKDPVAPSSAPDGKPAGSATSSENAATGLNITAASSGLPSLQWKKHISQVRGTFVGVENVVLSLTCLACYSGYSTSHRTQDSALTDEKQGI